MIFVILFFNQKTAYEMRISDWSSDVCSSDLTVLVHIEREQRHAGNRTVHMIPRPMVVQRARVEIVDEHAPARSAGKAHPGTAEVGFPAVERAERRAQRVADGTGCLAVEIGRAACRASVCQYW